MARIPRFSLVLLFWSTILIGLNFGNSLMRKFQIGIILPDTASFRQVKSALNFQISDTRNASPPHSFKLDSLEVGGIDWQEGYRVSKALCLALTRNPFAMIGHLNHRTASTIFGFTTTYHMPYLTISTPLNRSHVKMTSSSADTSSPASSSSSASADHHLYDLASYGMIRKPYHRHQRNNNSNSNKYNNNNNKYNNNKYNNNRYKHPYSVSMGGDDDDNDDDGDDGDDNSDDVFILHMRPSYDRALIDVILHYKWNHVYYVYDDVEGLYRLDALHEVANQPNSTMVIEPFRLVKVDDSYMVLRQLDQKGENGVDKYIVLDLSTEEALISILKQIQAVGMNRGGYHYLLGGLAIDEIDIDDFKHGGVNITGFLLINRSDIKIDLAQRDWAKLGEGPILKLEPALAMDSISVLTNAFSNMLQLNNDEFSDVFRRNYNFGEQKVDACMGNVTGPWIKGATIARHLKELTYPGLTGYISFDRWGYRKDYMLGVYELNLNNGLKQIATWHYTKGFVKTGVPDDTPTAADLKPLAVNRTRIVTTIISPPFLSYKKKIEDDKAATSMATTSDPSSQQAIGANKFEGYCAELTATLAQKVGFNYELRLVADEKYGAKTDNGTWNGMVGELTTKVADLAIAPLTISSIRERVIDFSKPFMNLGISIMIKKPEKQKPGVFSFMDPLAYDIWACIVISYLAVSFVLFLVSRFSPYEWQTDDNNNTNYDNTKDIGSNFADGFGLTSPTANQTAVVVPSYTNDFTILNSLWFSLAAFMRQGCDISPRSLSGRVVGSAWWFFTLIIISSYTANLAAFLTVERMLTPIESADDLSQQTEILYGTLEAGSTKDFFKNSKILIYMNMWQFMSTHPDVFVKTTEDGVSRVRNSKGKYAFLLESTMNDYYNQKKPCNTMKVGSDLDSKGYGVATPIGSDLREPIGLAILQLLESSYLQKLHKKWWYDKGECIPEDTKGGSSTQSALTLSNVAGIFYILIGGLGLSMLTSLLEFIYKSKREILKQKKTFAETARPKTRMSTGLTPDRENGNIGKLGSEYPMSPSSQLPPQQQPPPPEEAHHLLQQYQQQQQVPRQQQQQQQNLDDNGHLLSQRSINRNAIVLV